MDVINWWFAWPTWLQDLSVVLLTVIFLSHAPAAGRWPRGASNRS